MTKEKAHHKITKKHIKILLGIILILFSIFVLLNMGFISTSIVYAMVFLFGNLYFIPFVFLVYIGSTLIFKPVFTKVSKKIFVVLGSVFLILAILMALCFSIKIPGENGTNLTYVDLNFANFGEIFIKQIDGMYKFNKPVPVFEVNYGGGFIGYFLVASINTILTSHIATICIVAVLFLLALLFYLYYPIKSLVIYIKSESEDKTKNFQSAKKSKKESNVIEAIEVIDDSSSDKVEEDLNAEVSEIIINHMENKTKNAVDERKPIPCHDTGFVKPSFNLFGNDYSKVQSQTVVKQEEVAPQNQETYYEDDVYEEETYQEENNYSNNYTSQQSYSSNYSNNNNYDDDYQSNEEENRIGFVKEETLSNSNFEKEEFVTPEPPVSKPANKQPIVRQTREVITEVPEEMVGTVDVVINQHKPRRYKAPGVELLKDRSEDPAVIEENKRLNDERLSSINDIFGQLKVGAKATGYTIGPSVTRFDIFPNRDVSVTYIEKYVNDLSSRLGGVLARFEKIVQGKTSSALEIPNQKPMMVGFKEAYLDLPKKKPGADLYVPFGKNIDGVNIGANLAKFPHLLVSGSTGSGKSVYVNSLLITLLMRNSPDDLKLLIIDAKEIEFSRFNGIPHLLGPTVTSAAKAKIALDRLAQEMDNRYSFLKIYDYSDIKDYNEEAEQRGLPKLPYIVCVIDEYADLMENDKTITAPVNRLCAKARSAGIHLIIATQRPSTNVITGTIKSNIPTRVAFMASSSVDSRVMLDQNGAESLVGNGDMLVSCPLISRNSLIRAQGAFISSLEIKNILNELKNTYKPEYDPNFTNLTIVDEFAPSNSTETTGYLDQNSVDPLYPKVREYVYGLKYCSISNLQRVFGVGFNRGVKLLNQLVKDGIVSQDEGCASRGKEVIIHSEAEFNDLVLEKEEI